MRDDRSDVGGRPVCRLCGGGECTQLVTGYDRLEARTQDFTYYRCTDCGLVFLDPQPTLEEIQSFYPDDYEAHESPPRPRRDTLMNRLAVRYFYSVGSIHRSKVVRAVFRLLSPWILRRTEEPIGENRLLDVGCGSGALLVAHRELGWSVFGVEPSARASAACRKLGLDVHQGTLLDPELDGREFDVIVMSHVIEHVPDPLALLRRAAGLVAPGGRIVLTTPNARSLTFRMFGSCWFALEAPRHLFLFDPQTLRLLGRRAGLVARRMRSRVERRVLDESVHIARTQGAVVPSDASARIRTVERSRQAPRPSRRIFKLGSAILTPAGWLGLGDVIEVDFVRPRSVVNQLSSPG